MNITIQPARAWQIGALKHRRQRSSEVSQGVHYDHPAQVWTAMEAIADAAARAHDKSNRGARNTLAPEHVPNL